MRERGRGEGSMETGMKGGNCGEGNGENMLWGWG